MLTRRQFLASTASVAGVAAVGLPAIAIAAEDPWPVWSITFGPGGINEFIPYPGWRFRVRAGGELIHEPIPEGQMTVTEIGQRQLETFHRPTAVYPPKLVSFGRRSQGVS